MSLWKVRERPDGPAPDRWAEILSISPLLLDLLWGRGFRQIDSMGAFLEPRLSSLTHPRNWPQIPEAAELIARELLAGKTMAIWGDYDVDGITATALALDVLEEHGFTVLHHLPDRRVEGYGLNSAALEELAAKGCQTLLTVDCGISNADVVRRANELGITVIISDHHLPPENLPPAACIVNPRMEGAGQWPCPHLAGVGVAFYLLAAVNINLAPHTGKRYKMDNVLDLVALGTLADVMRLEGENRILARGGLQKMTQPRRPGLSALKKISGFNDSAEISSGQAVFRLAPRINAAGRMGSADLALALLQAKDKYEAEDLAGQLDDCNNRRKAEEDRVHKAAREEAMRLLQIKNYAALALYGPDWHPGIVGIVASRIVEEFNRPTVVLCDDRGSLKGSGRTVGNFNLHEGLSKTSGLLIGFGGHRQAAGLRLEKANLEKFRDAFSQTAREAMGDKPYEPVITLERELDFRQASDHVFLKEMQLMQPFGPGNPEPVFFSPKVTVLRQATFGNGREHALLHLRDEKSNVTMAAKAWRMAARIPQDLVGKQIRIAYSPKLDFYNRIPTVDIGIKDLKTA